MDRTGIHIGRTSDNLLFFVHAYLRRLYITLKTVDLTLQGTWMAPIVLAAPQALAKGLSSLISSFPKVTRTLGNRLARITGAMQHAPIGFLALLKAQRISATPWRTVILGPFTPKLERFLAAPNPPGRITAYNVNCTWWIKKKIIRRSPRFWVFPNPPH